MSDMAEYRIEFSIQRREGDSDDFVEIGFGSSNAWRDLNQASFEVDAAVQNRDWETSDDMPEPRSVS